MTQPGGRQLAHMWAVMTSVFASAAAEMRAEGHLAPDAVVAFVDGELSLVAYERAARHLGHCPLCTAEVATQRQASIAVRDAGAPVVPATLLAALHDIPQRAPLSSDHQELAVTEDGQLVVVQRQAASHRIGSRPPLGTGAPLGSSQRLGSSGFGTGLAHDGPATDSPDSDTGSAADIATTGRRRTGRLAQGAGVVVSGLVIGALVLAAPTEPANTPAGPGGQRYGGVGGQLPVNAELVPADQAQLAAVPRRPALAMLAR